MAEVLHQIAVAFGVQSVVGTADATIAALAGALVEADGIVLGDPDSGKARSGIEFATSRDLKEKADVSGSFTKQASTFKKELLETFSIAIPLAGRGTSTPTLDSHYTPAKGIDALLQASGLAGAAWSGGVGWVYTPLAAQIITAKVWISGSAYVVRDCLVDSVEFAMTPGDVVVATFNLRGTISSFAAATFPTPNYGNQATLSAPVLTGANHNWGISAALRGFTDGALAISNSVEDLDDSNNSRQRQTGREILFTGKVIADSGDIDFERGELVRTNAPTEMQRWQLGTAGGTTANAVRFTMTAPELTTHEPDIFGTALVVGIELRAVGAAANNEFELLFN